MSTMPIADLQHAVMPVDACWLTVTSEIQVSLRPDFARVPPLRSLMPPARSIWSPARRDVRHALAPPLGADLHDHDAVLPDDLGQIDLVEHGIDVAGGRLARRGVDGARVARRVRDRGRRRCEVLVARELADDPLDPAAQRERTRPDHPGRRAAHQQLSPRDLLQVSSSRSVWYQRCGSYATSRASEELAPTLTITERFSSRSANRWRSSTARSRGAPR